MLYINLPHYCTCFQLTHSIDELDLRPEYKRALLKYENGEFYVSCLSKFVFNELFSCVNG